VNRVDEHRFNMERKSLEKEIFDSAIKKARIHQNKDVTKARASRYTRKICAAAFKEFEEILKEKFPSDNYKDIVSLAAMSAEKRFFSPFQNPPSLEERLASVMLESLQADEHV